MTRRTVFLLGLPGLSGCFRDRTSRLNVFNWSSYVGPETIPAFEREFKVRVRYAVYESNEEMLARVMSGNSGWDVVFPTSYLIEPMRHFDLLARLDHSRLSNLHHLEPSFRNPEWDRDLRWGVPYMWNATGICHSSVLDFDIEAWEDLWSPELQGRMTMLDDPVDVFAACLLKLGLPINTKDPAHLRAAQKQAMDQKDMLRAYMNAEVRDQLVAGDVLAAQLWSTTAQQAVDASPELEFVYPSEGFPIYPDVAVILRESRRKELAHHFLNYLLRPAVAAGVIVGARTASANGSARALLPEELAENPTLYPPEEVLARGQWAAASTPEIQRLRDRLWTEIKAS
ncbi:MAG TPA: spermidine/putrescine ABC transporter substrate-binding protein [Bryobacteraceae bacterium]|nr:spermidine/putrescine ABC transporter substrate-binding protein [Bryobacteraceae bacterium]